LKSKKKLFPFKKLSVFYKICLKTFGSHLVDCAQFFKIVLRRISALPGKIVKPFFFQISHDTAGSIAVYRELHIIRWPGSRGVQIEQISPKRASIFLSFRICITLSFIVNFFKTKTAEVLVNFYLDLVKVPTF
jgi:hypothetical protein